MNHDEASELLGAYALDAVDASEAEAIDDHLETCPRCRDELRGHREVVGLLAYAGHDAPEGMWDRVAARMHDPDAGDGGPAAPVPGVARLDDRRRRAVLAGRPARWLGLVAAAAVVVVALLGVEVVRLQNRTDHLTKQVAAMSNQPTMAAVKLALSTPGARVVRLQEPGGATTELDAVILPGGQGYLYDSALAPLPAARTYQLWGVVGNEVVSYGLLGSAPARVEAFRASPGVSALAVTDEVAGGVVASVHKPVAVGDVD